MTRKKTVPPILPETFEGIVAPWLQGIAHKDIVAVVSYPASDRQRRMLQLLADKKLQRKYLGNPARYLWVSVDFRVDPIDDVIDLEHHIQKAARSRIKKSQKIILTCMGCEKLLQKQYLPLLIWFTLQCRVDSMRTLLFFEANLFAPLTLELFGSVPAFQPRITYLPLYEETDTRQFIRHMTEIKWRFNITSGMADRIVAECGGVFLLVKEALWHLRDHPKAATDAIFSHTEMQFNLAVLWNGFANEEQKVLERVVKRKALDDQSYDASIRYLERMRFIVYERTGWRLTVPRFSRYLRELFTQNKHLTLNDQKEILLDGVPVGGQFSRAQRRILVHLLSHTGDVVPRDVIAELLWPHDTQAQYSDWAIDSAISRLRLRLTRLGIDNKRIKTMKGKGVIFR